MLLKAVKYALLALVLLQVGAVNGSSLEGPQAAQVDLEGFKNLVTERFNENQEERFLKITRIGEICINAAAEELNFQEDPEYIALTEELGQELMGLYAQAGIDPATLSQDQHQEVAALMSELHNEIILHFSQNSPASELAPYDLPEATPIDTPFEQPDVIFVDGQAIENESGIGYIQARMSFPEFKDHFIGYFTANLHDALRRVNRTQELGAKKAEELTQQEVDEFRALIEESANETRILFEQAGISQESLTEEERQELLSVIRQLFTETSQPQSWSLPDKEHEERLRNQFQLGLQGRESSIDFDELKRLVHEDYLANREGRIEGLKRIMLLTAKAGAQQQEPSAEDAAEIEALQSAFEQQMVTFFTNAGVDPEALPMEQQQELQEIISQQMAEIARASLPELSAGQSYLFEDQMENEIRSQIQNLTGISEIPNDEPEDGEN